MKNKNIKLLVLSLAGLFALTACNDEVVAKPGDYNDSLITVNDYTAEIYNNLNSVVEDQIHSDGISGEVLDQILYLYAVNAFGAYDTSVVAGGVEVKEGEVTLEDAQTSTDNMNKFVRAHKVYWDESRTSDEAAASADEVIRVQTKWKSINNRIAKEMYNKISVVPIVIVTISMNPDS